MSNLQEELEKIYDKQIQDPEDSDSSDSSLDINDYVLAEEESVFLQYVSLLNIFTCYFKQLFRRQQDETMFDHIENHKDTNRCMEFMYEEINKYRIADDPDKDTLFNTNDESISIESCKELYILYLDDCPTYCSKYILPLMRFLATLEWNTVNWSVIPVKTT